MSDAAAAEQSPAPIRRNGFTNEALEWHSWLQPLDIAQASPLHAASLLIDAANRGCGTHPY